MTAIDLETDLRHRAPPADPAAAENAAIRFAARADREGLADLAYALVPTPLGELGGVCSRRGLVSLSFDADHLERTLDTLARAVSRRIVESPARLDDVRRELDEYFDRRRTSFDLALDPALIRGPFAQRVLRVTAAIPYGQTSTYTDVAGEAGNPRASRAAGNALGSNPIPVVIPCHRVLRSGGNLGGYGGGLERKRALLAVEGALES
jgi:methylated-DNA-[protein]-cysteine S-methyltransferase